MKIWQIPCGSVMIRINIMEIFIPCAPKEEIMRQSQRGVLFVCVLIFGGLTFGWVEAKQDQQNDVAVPSQVLGVPATYVVDPGAGGDYATIQACITAAVPGDTCQVNATLTLSNYAGNSTIRMRSL